MFARIYVPTPLTDGYTLPWHTLTSAHHYALAHPHTKRAHYTSELLVLHLLLLF